MRELYCELRVYPDSYLELFTDFILDFTREAIEEVEERGGERGIVVRSEDGLEELLQALRTFSTSLSERIGEKVDFTHQLTWQRNEDWIEKYKQSVQPIACAPFYIRPSWCPARKEFIDILIDPALAFGSGHHATTFSCLTMLGALELDKAKVLDVGCGSGILSIAALKKGACVQACDTDELAVSETLKNIQLNGESPIKCWVGSIDDSDGGYDLIIANIIAVVILALAPHFHKKLQPKGRVILSGVLATSRDEILRKFSGFELEQELLQDEWVTLQLRKQ